MTIILITIAALAASVVVFEVGSSLQTVTWGKQNRLGGLTGTAGQIPQVRRRSSVEAVLIAVLPNNFDPERSKNAGNVVDLIRRSGYVYDTPGSFYAAAMRTFALYLLLAGVFSGALVAFGAGIAVPVIASALVIQGLRKPYSVLKKAVKKRAEGVRNNMLIGLSVLNSLLDSGVGTQEALRRVATVGGPFCNLMGLLVARIEVEPIEKAIATVSAHVPDTNDVEIMLFLRDIEDFFVNNRPIAASVNALQESVHRSVVEETESRAALVKQRAGLFGVMAVVGLMISMLAPYML